MSGVPRPAAAAGLLVALSAAALPAVAATQARPAPAVHHRTVLASAGSTTGTLPWVPTINLGEVAALGRGRTPATAPGPTAVGLLPLAAGALPPVSLQAYRTAASLAPAGCRLPWELLAGIGTVESNNAADGGAWTAGWDGTANPPIYGPLLDGSLPGTAVVRNTDPALDGPGPYARAVGPMQFLPSTWQEYAINGNNDGTANPQDIFDASAAAGQFLCSNGGNLADPTREAVAVYAYNPSTSYVQEVLTLAAEYAGVAVPRFVGTAPAHAGHPTAHPARHPSPAPHHRTLAAGPSSPSPAPAAQPAPAPAPTSPATGALPAPVPSLPAPPPSLPVTSAPAGWTVTLPGRSALPVTLVDAVPSTAPSGLVLTLGTVNVLAGPATLLGNLLGATVTLTGPSGATSYVVRTAGTLASAPAGDLVIVSYPVNAPPLTLLAAPA